MFYLKMCFKLIFNFNGGFQSQIFRQQLRLTTGLRVDSAVWESQTSTTN